MEVEDLWFSGIKTELLLFVSVSPFQRLFRIVVCSTNFGAKLCLTNVYVTVSLGDDYTAKMKIIRHCIVFFFSVLACQSNRLKINLLLGKIMTALFSLNSKLEENSKSRL